MECAPRQRGRWEAAHEGREDWKARQEERRDAAKEGQRGGKGSLCGFESTLQQLPDKLVFPGTPQDHSARKRIMHNALILRRSS